MTDNEIIKALECCISENNSCRDCPYSTFDIDCTERRNNDCLDLINRQQAEIERLQKETMNMAITIETCQTEAVKEYREKAAIKLVENARSDYWHWIDDTLYEVEKEMVGE